jgi:hypothetical protein
MPVTTTPTLTPTSDLQFDGINHPQSEGQPRRGDLKVAQDVVLGKAKERLSSPGGTAESHLLF